MGQNRLFLQFRDFLILPFNMDAIDKKLINSQSKKEMENFI